MKTGWQMVVMCACVGTMACGGLGGAEEEVEVNPVDARVQGADALWTFNEGGGSVVFDQSGVGEPADLVIIDAAANVEWFEKGLNIINPTYMIPTNQPTKIEDACRASGQFTAEFWLRPDAITQSATIVTQGRIEEGEGVNYRIRQEQTDIQGRIRSTGTDLNASPYVTSGADQCCGIDQSTHVVVAWGPGEAKVYMNGEMVNSEVIGGTMDNWGTQGVTPYQFIFANSLALNDPYLGELFMAALYCRQLSASEVTQNFTARF